MWKENNAGGRLFYSKEVELEGDRGHLIVQTRDKKSVDYIGAAVNAKSEDEFALWMIKFLPFGVDYSNGMMESGHVLQNPSWGYVRRQKKMLDKFAASGEHFDELYHQVPDLKDDLARCLRTYSDDYQKDILAAFGVPRSIMR